MKIFILVLHRASISVETGIQRRKRKAGRQMIVRFPNLKVASGLGNLTRQMIAADCALLLQLLVLREMQARMIIQLHVEILCKGLTNNLLLAFSNNFLLAFCNCQFLLSNTLIVYVHRMMCDTLWTLISAVLDLSRRSGFVGCCFANSPAFSHGT